MDPLGTTRSATSGSFFDSLASSLSEPWVINYCGFQLSLLSNGGKAFACSSRGGLRTFVNDFGLVDLDFGNNPYTWNNGRGGRANIREG